MGLARNLKRGPLPPTLEHHINNPSTRADISANNHSLSIVKTLIPSTQYFDIDKVLGLLVRLRIACSEERYAWSGFGFDHSVLFSFSSDLIISIGRQQNSATLVTQFSVFSFRNSTMADQQRRTSKRRRSISIDSTPSQDDALREISIAGCQVSSCIEWGMPQVTCCLCWLHHVL